MGNGPLRVLPKPTEHKLLCILLPSSTLHQRDYTSIQWLISDHCSTTFNFSNPKISNAQNLSMVSGYNIILRNEIKRGWGGVGSSQMRFVTIVYPLVRNLSH